MCIAVWWGRRAERYRNGAPSDGAFRYLRLFDAHHRCLPLKHPFRAATVQNEPTVPQDYGLARHGAVETQTPADSAASGGRILDYDFHVVGIEALSFRLGMAGKPERRQGGGKHLRFVRIRRYGEFAYIAKQSAAIKTPGVLLFACFSVLVRSKVRVLGFQITREHAHRPRQDFEIDRGRIPTYIDIFEPGDLDAA